MKSRAFSKSMAVWNSVAAWAVIGISVWRGGDVEVIMACLAFCASVLGSYMGVGHLDYRTAAKAEEE